LTSGLATIAHLIYYPKGRATYLLAKDRLVNSLFISTILFGGGLFVSSVVLFDRWKNGVFSQFSNSSLDNLKYVSLFNLLVSLFLGVSVLLICSFLANYMEKLRISSAR
jgi:hypothetical protein